MRLLRETGFFRTEPMDVGGVKVSPRALTERLLFTSWKLPPGEEEFTLMQVTCEGVEGGVRRRRRYDLFDRTDTATGATSMARTTGFPCTVTARLLAEGAYREPGVHPPEHLGADAALYQTLVSRLAEKGVRLTERVEELPADE
jgi:saccharopine dehydrogenase-like NADP-dependent oxidoreductase